MKTHQDFFNSFSKELKLFMENNSNCFFPSDFLKILKEKEIKIVTVESCTGGLIAKTATDFAGSSNWFWGAFVTYDNSAKTAIGVPDSVIKNYGAVSKECVTAMAECGLKQTASKANLAVAVSGIAGPSGGTDEKPVGTVWLAVCAKISIKNAGSPAVQQTGEHIVRAIKFLFSGTREEIRKKTTFAAFFLIYREILRKNETIDTLLIDSYI